MTKELLLHLGSCGLSLDRPNQKNYDPLKEDGSADDHYYTLSGMWDKPESECLEFCLKNNLMKDLAWYIEKRGTEVFVRYTGKVFTMGRYQVFNPLEGSHVYVDTEEEAKEICRTYLQQLAEQNLLKINICRELSNEHGHSTWIASELNTTIEIPIKV